MGIEDIMEAADFIGDIMEVTGDVVSAKRENKKTIKRKVKVPNKKINAKEENIKNVKAHKNKQQSEQDEKLRMADEQRKADYEGAKSKNSLKQASKQSNARLKEAIILAEIIGQPRCKTRQNRRARSVWWELKYY